MRQQLIRSLAAHPLREALVKKVDGKAKPIGALGRLEEIAITLGCMQNSLEPHIHAPQVLVFAADHGIAASGTVNAYPQAITGLMVHNFLQGGAAINAICQARQLDLTVVDAGMVTPCADHTQLIQARIAAGTADYRMKKAMTRQQVQACFDKGAELINALIKRTQTNCIAFGEMGIGNSSAAALLLSSLTGRAIEDCVGAGAGADAQQLAQKKATLRSVMDLHQPTTDPVQALSRFGGFEIAMMTGAMLEAARQEVCIVVDGFIVTAALLCAWKAEAAVTDWCLFAHASAEPGHRYMMETLAAAPLLDLGMRLGEGTGAALAIALLQSATACFNQMADLQDLLP